MFTVPQRTSAKKNSKLKFFLAGKMLETPCGQPPYFNRNVDNFRVLLEAIFVLLRATHCQDANLREYS